MKYTNEQLKYIEYNKKMHTKLIACAGSGKTRCIIAKIKNLINKKIYDKSEILVLTFSRFTRDDFINKINVYSKDDDIYIDQQNINTIDKFSKLIIDPDNKIDVSLLSYRLMKFLESTKTLELKKNEILKKIRTVFIDEAQDLNEVQFRIILALKNKLKIVINLIGDPNQNIYQFRQSSDKYLTEFKAETFILTNNFRSHLSIVNFSKHLRPFTNNDVVCTKGQNNCKPVLSFYDNEKILEDNVIGLLNDAKNRKIDLSDFAILSPTRGRMRGSGKSHGLCFISNILYKAGIKFKQFYEESTEEVSAEGIKYLPEKNHVNILTYMGSKGLEWKYVILIDADSCLINKNEFTDIKHNQDRYLLYVACSRAIDNMFIFSNCNIVKGSYTFKTNSWFNIVPNEFYDIDDKFLHNFKIAEPQFRTAKRNVNETQLSKIIDRIDCQALDELSNLLDFQKIATKKIYSNHTKIAKNLFFVKYVFALFQGLYNIKMKNKQERIMDIEYALDGDAVVTNMSDDVVEWYKKHRNYSWNQFDQDKSIQKSIKDAINNKFDRTVDFGKHVISFNGYYQLYILSQKQWIKNMYQKYLICKNSKQLRELLFYLTVIKHSIETHHYYHIKTQGADYKYILNDYDDLYDDIESYIDSLDHNFKSINKIVNSTEWHINGKIDLIDDDNNIWFIKFVDEISLKHMIYAIVIQLVHENEEINDIDIMIDKNVDDDINNNDEIIKTLSINYINLLKGEEVTYKQQLTKNKIIKIKELLLKN